MSFTRDRMMLQPQLVTPGHGSMTSRSKASISSWEAATRVDVELVFAGHPVNLGHRLIADKIAVTSARVSGRVSISK